MSNMVLLTQAIMEANYTMDLLSQLPPENLVMIAQILITFMKRTHQHSAALIFLKQELEKEFKNYSDGAIIYDGVSIKQLAIYRVLHINSNAKTIMHFGPV